MSRKGVDHTGFSELPAAVAKLSARTLVLDGEVAIYDQQLRSWFDWLREPDPDAVASPPLLMAFDILFWNRRDLTGRRRGGRGHRGGVGREASEVPAVWFGFQPLADLFLVARKTWKKGISGDGASRV